MFRHADQPIRGAHRRAAIYLKTLPPPLPIVLFGILVFVLTAPAGGADLALPPDLQRVIDENARSLSQLRSISASATISETFEARGRRGTFQDNVAIWTKGRKVREDWSAVPGTPRESRRVVEALPDGSRMTIGPPDASRHVITPEVEFKFRPGECAIALVSGQPDAPFGRQSSLLHEYASVQGRTLAGKVRQEWARGYQPTVSPVTDDNVDSVLIHWEYPQAQMALKVWIDPARGCMIRKLQSYYKDELVTQWTSQLKDYGGGVFWPAQVERREWASGRVTRQVSVTVKSLEVNPTLDDGMFTLEGVGLPQGAEVQDRMLGLRYRFGAEPKLSEEFLQSVIAPEAGNRPTALSRAADAGSRTPSATAHGVTAGPTEVTPSLPASVVASSARDSWIWAAVAALTASAGTGCFLVWRCKWRQQEQAA